MTREYVLRLGLWAALVVGCLTAAGMWFLRSVPHVVEQSASGKEASTAPGRGASDPARRAGDQFPDLARFVNRPLEWAARSWLFLAVVGFLVLSAWGVVGRPLGVFDLIHAETRWLRVLNGLALGLAAGSALFVAYATLMDAVPWPVTPDWTLFPVGPAGGRPGEADAVRRAGNFLLVCWVPALVLIAAPWRRWPPGHAADRFPGLTLGLGLSVLLSTGLVFAMWEVLTRPELSGGWREWYDHTPGAADGRIPPTDYALHLIATGFTALPAALILLHAAAALGGRTGSPVWVVCLSLWLFTSGYGFVSFHFAGLQTVLLVMVGAVVLVANARHPYKMTLPNMDPEYAAARSGRPLPLGVTESPVGGGRVSLLGADEVLGKFRERWQREHGPGTRPKLVVVCTSGGGIRAAVWTAVVLDGLGRRVGPRFADHVRLITGASGGMVAAALYAAARVHPLPAGRSAACVLAEDCLWPTWQGLFFTDLPAVVSPFYRAWDRGKSLEASWHRNAPPRDKGGVSPMRTTFADLLPAERAGLAPSVVFSPMLVEDGRRLLISNLDLSDLACHSAATLGIGPEGQAAADRQRTSQPAVEFFRLFPRAHGRFQVGTAARLSATFPYVSPTVSLPTAPPRRAVDAGFYDNYGVGLAAGWLLRHRDAVRAHCGGVAVVEVRAFPLEHEKTGVPAEGTEVRKGTGGALSSALAGVSTPAEALGVVRAAGAYYRNDHLLELLDAEFNAGRPDPFFVRVPVECPGPGSLSWAITSRDRDDLIEAFESADGELSRGVRGEVLGLRGWFGDGGG